MELNDISCGEQFIKKYIQDFDSNNNKKFIYH